MLDRPHDNQMRGTICIEDLEIGLARSVSKTVTDEDIALFAQVSTDHNPVHLDDSYAQDTIFEGRIAHGMLTAGLISAVIGEQLPGHGTVYMGQTLKFLAPVRPGDMVHAEVEVVGMYPNYAAAYDAWKGAAQRSVDNAHMRFFIVHVHRLLDPETDTSRS